MERKQKVITTFLVLVLVVVVFYFSTKAITQYTGYVISGGDENDIDSFAKCLGKMEVRMYGTFGCSFCQKQEGDFGGGDIAKGKQILIDNGIYYECDPRGEDSKYQECIYAEIQGYPTWVINGKQEIGRISLERIAELSGCSLE